MRFRGIRCNMPRLNATLLSQPLRAVPMSFPVSETEACRANCPAAMYEIIKRTKERERTIETNYQRSVIYRAQIRSYKTGQTLP
jgi:hypothetical protein